MSEQSLITGLVAAVVVVVVIGRQFLPQRVNGGRFWVFPVILTVYGLYEIGKQPPAGAVDVALLALNVVVGIALGFARGYSMRYWRDATGQLMRQGTILTFALWVLSFGIRFGLEFVVYHGFTGRAQSELPLFIGATLGAQALAMWMRTQRVGDGSSYQAIR
jgi:small-conductance mechanosensitive channel